MDYKCAVAICILISVVLVQGQLGQGERCLCTSFSKNLNINRVVKLEIYPPGSKCANKEYIVTVKRPKNSKKSGSRTEEKCVDPAMKQLKTLIQGKHKRKIQVVNHSSKIE